MRKVTTTTQTTANTQVQITKTPFWLNVKSSVSNIGINLAKGIKQHDVYLDLISEVGLDAVNEYLAEQGEPLYIVEEGKSSTSNSHVKSLAERIKSKSV